MKRYITQQHYTMLSKKIDNLIEVSNDIASELAALRDDSVAMEDSLPAPDLRGKTQLAANILYLMSKKGIKSVASLSRLSGIPQPTMHKIIAGEVKSPGFEKLKQIADVLGVNLLDLATTKMTRK